MIMIMVYYGGLGVGFEKPYRIDLTKEKIVYWQIVKVKVWNSANLVIDFEFKKFNQPVPMIVNYNDVVRWLKKHKIF